MTVREFAEAKQALEELGFFGTDVFGDYLPAWFATPYPESKITQRTTWQLGNSKSPDGDLGFMTRSKSEIDLTDRPSTPRVRLPRSHTQFTESSIAERTFRPLENSKSPDGDPDLMTRSRSDMDMRGRSFVITVKLPRSLTRRVKIPLLPTQFSESNIAGPTSRQLGDSMSPDEFKESMARSRDEIDTRPRDFVRFGWETLM